MNLFLSPEEEANKQSGKCNFSPTPVCFLYSGSFSFYFIFFFPFSCRGALAEDSVCFSLAPANFPKIFFNLMAKQRVLIIGHSFVHRLKAFVQIKIGTCMFLAALGVWQVFIFMELAAAR